MSEPGSAHNKSASDHLVARYEELRQQFRRHDTSHGMGLSLLMHHGMKVWMDAWSRYIPCCPDPEPHSEESVSVDLQSDMTIILAGMVLHAWQQETRC